MTNTPLRLTQVFAVLSAGLVAATALLHFVAPSLVNPTVWIRAVGVLVLSLLYLRWAARLRGGSRRVYRRLLWVSVAGSLGIAALALLPGTPYPAWVRVEQAVQGVILLALAWVLTRPAVRAHLEPAR
ncbi:hypothetical protein FH608_031040 [Nonomuraea phyllanthi]|uniref:Uncharacterized protein n=1 Tax=Nonomuraea phyllanthi TaxID=2219224 RepID=A0A5C4VI75_9ACTN|nr:hypothetical protein [Nonomuraea phyllanthi]KAB8191066.1 hypothetical protein FH608_031040 [Nonomuraea phyllanthi]